MPADVDAPAPRGANPSSAVHIANWNFDFFLESENGMYPTRFESGAVKNRFVVKRAFWRSNSTIGVCFFVASAARIVTVISATGLCANRIEWMAILASVSWPTLGTYLRAFVRELRMLRAVCLAREIFSGSPLPSMLRWTSSVCVWNGVEASVAFGWRCK